MAENLNHQERVDAAIGVYEITQKLMIEAERLIAQIDYLTCLMAETPSESTD